MIIFISPPFGNYIKNFKINSKIFDTEIEFVPIKGSFTLLERPGLICQIFKTLRYCTIHNGWINKIGLRNKGIDYALEKYPESGKDNQTILSVAILNTLEIPKLVNKIPEDVNLELNVSCPNVGHRLCDTDIDKFLNNKRKWCIVKLAPNTPKETIDEFYKQGFRQFHCSNTLPVRNGGLSGETLIPYTTENTRYIKNKYTDAEVVCGGGITSKEDIQNYKENGADYYSISTICFSPHKFIKLLFEL
jgi:dihydroorotate dehydrogenase